MPPTAWSCRAPKSSPVAAGSPSRCGVDRKPLVPARASFNIGPLISGGVGGTWLRGLRHRRQSAAAQLGRPAFRPRRGAEQFAPRRPASLRMVARSAPRIGLVPEESCAVPVSPPRRATRPPAGRRMHAGRVDFHGHRHRRGRESHLLQLEPERLRLDRKVHHVLHGTRCELVKPDDLRSSVSSGRANFALNRWK